MWQTSSGLGYCFLVLTVMHQPGAVCLAHLKAAVLASCRQFYLLAFFSSVCVCVIKYNSVAAKGYYNCCSDSPHTTTRWTILQSQCVRAREGERERAIGGKESEDDSVQSAARCLCCYLIRFRPQSEVSFSHLLQHWSCVCVRARPDNVVFVCLCSPILPLTLYDNRLYHTLHFCVCVWVYWPVYMWFSPCPAQSYSGCLYRDGGVMPCDCNNLLFWWLRNTRCAHTHTFKQSGSSLFTLSSMCDNV